MASRDAMKRDYCQLAHVYEEKRQFIAGWFVSEKLDGLRALWDGGISRGLPASEVPYMNCVKDSRYKEPPICTGLFTRYGNVIHAPDCWLDDLPNYCLDGEIWAGRNSFQRMSSIVKDLNPSDGWDDVTYQVFDSPPPALLFSDGDVRVQGYKVFLRDCFQWWTNCGGKGTYTTTFEETNNYLKKHLGETKNLKLLGQIRLPFATQTALDELHMYLNNVTNDGGEGLILRKPTSMWEPKRSYSLLKVKKFQDAEATVIGYTTGRETDKGSKLLGLMGALVMSYKGHRLELSGFTDEERILNGSSGDEPLASGITARQWATENPEKEVPTWITNPKFPRGSQVTFRYRELTDAGIPKEARYWRKA